VLAQTAADHNKTYRWGGKLPMKRQNLETLISQILWIQARNLRAYLSHRKRRMRNLSKSRSQRCRVNLSGSFEVRISNWKNGAVSIKLARVTDTHLGIENQSYRAKRLHLGLRHYDHAQRIETSQKHCIAYNKRCMERTNHGKQIWVFCATMWHKICLLKHFQRKGVQPHAYDKAVWKDGSRGGGTDYRPF
jgi:hypothetical protein